MSLATAPTPVARTVFWAAMRQAFGGAGIALASSFFALGALFNDSGLALWESVFFSFIVFALPGQLAAAELFARETALAIIVISVLLVNMRLMPMTIVLLPLMRPPAQRSWRDFLVSHLIAVTSWVSFISTHHSVPQEWRYYYYVWMASTLWICGCLFTIFGYLTAALIPPWLLPGLLFLNPIYFLCMMLRAISHKREAAAMLAGMILLPPLHLISGEWDIIAAGIIGGGAAYFLVEWRTKH
ncbi:MAG: AzlC family ABC transporter permease [Gammaproteobacteria bacterium WSBS_2016_MAG_OTU1]